MDFSSRYTRTPLSTVIVLSSPSSFFQRHFFSCYSTALGSRIKGRMSPKQLQSEFTWLSMDFYVGEIQDGELISATGH
jgi:hypothetical protein